MLSARAFTLQKYKHFNKNKQKSKIRQFYGKKNEQYYEKFDISAYQTIGGFFCEVGKMK